MNLNHTPLSRYKSPRPGQTSETVKTSSAEVSRQKAIQADIMKQNTDIKPETYKEGQIVKGEVIDLRYQEVKIRLEPGNHILTAKLSGDVPLTIGQTADFQVTDSSSEHFTLRYIPREQSFQELTVQKALAASTLPLTERNRAIVIELLNHKLPIDKQTLQTLARYAGMNRNASPLALVLMYKNHIPITSANIKQFEAYQNGTHQILPDIHTISKNITDLIKESLADPLKNQGHTISSGSDLGSDVVASQEEPMDSRLLASAKGTWVETTNNTSSLSSDIFNLLLDYVANLSTTENNISSYLSQGELTILSEELEQKLDGNGDSSSNFSSDIQLNLNMQSNFAVINQIREGTLSLSDIIKVIDKIYHLDLTNGQIPFIQSEALQVTSPSVIDVIDHLLEEYSLQEEKQASLRNALEYALGKTLVGQETLKDMLGGSPHIYKLLKEAFHQKWTRTPEQLSEPDSIKRLYTDLQNDLEQLNNLLRFHKDSQSSLLLEEPVRNLQDNLQFMKSLNEIFTYVQLPVHFQDRDVHGEFYIYNKKKALHEKKDNLSVLLHLDMAGLGPLNIHMILELTRLQATFYTEDESVSQIIKEHLPELADALTRKGYHLQARVEHNPVRPDIIKDILEQDSTDGSVMRYSFDIRA